MQGPQPRFLQTEHVSEFRSLSMSPMPSTGSIVLRSSMNVSGIHCEQKRWHHLLLPVGFSAPPGVGHRQHCGVRFEGFFFLKTQALQFQSPVGTRTMP